MFDFYIQSLTGIPGIGFRFLLQVKGLIRGLRALAGQRCMNACEEPHLLFDACYVDNYPGMWPISDYSRTIYAWTRLGMSRCNLQLRRNILMSKTVLSGRVRAGK